MEQESQHLMYLSIWIFFIQVATLGTENITGGVGSWRLLREAPRFRHFLEGDTKILPIFQGGGHLDFAIY